MKKITYILFLTTFISCSTKKLYFDEKLNKEYTNITFFDCDKQNDFVANSDKRKLIFKILSRAVVEEKAILDYTSIRDKTKIYVLDTCFSNLKMGYMGEYEKFSKNDIPTSINKVLFCVKSKQELQQIANQTSDFLFLSIGNIKIENSRAKIGISNNWVFKDKINRKSYPLSGGGHILTYKKVGNNWVYDEKAEQVFWQS